MEWQRAWREERAALMRLVALLHALAGLAERAAGRSAAIRGIVLWLLRRAEPIARDYVCGEEDMPACGDDDMPPATGPWPAAPCPVGNRPEDALHLAETFRALAWLLEAQIGEFRTQADGGAGWTADRSARRAAAERTLAALAAILTHAHPLRVRAPDTS